MFGLEAATLPLVVQRLSAFPNRDRVSASVGRSLPERPPRVCRNCRLGKRKCDKHHPACGRCKRLGLDCSYDELDIIQITTSKGTPASEDPRNTSQVTLALPMELDPLGSYPIQARWYMPFLLQQFLQDFGMSGTPVDPKSIAYQMQTVYMPHSLTDPCMFHASMYAASAHLDAARNDCDNPITLYHKSETLHHIRRRIAQSQEGIGEGLDGAIAGVIPLAFFAYLSGDITESKSHLDGLVHMMAINGGRGSLELRGLLGGLVTLSALVFTIIFDHPYLELSTLAWSMWPLRPPMLYISNLASEALRAFDEDRLSKAVYDAIHDIYDVTRSFSTPSHNRHHRAYITSIYNRWRSERDSYENALDSAEFSAFSERSKKSRTPIYSAVYLTAILFFSILDDSGRSPDKTHVQCRLLEELTVVLRGTKNVMWLEANPYIFSWLCLTGAAASEGVHQRAWFYYLQGPVFMALNNGPSCIQNVLSYYTWLRNRVTQLYDCRPTMSRSSSTHSHA